MILLSLWQSGQRVDPRKAISEQFTKESWDPDTWIGVVVVAAAILILFVLLHFIMYYEKRSGDPQLARSPHKLFRDLLSFLQLGHSQKELLKRIAKDLQLQSPSTMLLSPGRFVEHSKRWLAQTQDGSNRYGNELDRIAEVVFASPPEHSGS